MPNLELPVAACAGVPAALLRVASVAVLLCVAACASRVPAPVEDRSPRTAAPAPVAAPAPPQSPAALPDWRPPAYTVKRGDTLYAIALDHGLDYRDLAAWNNLENANRIRVGQVLRLSAPGESAAPAAIAASGVQTTPLRTVPPIVAAEAGDSRTARPPPPVAGPRNTDTYKTQPKSIKEPYTEQALRDVQQRAAGAAVVPPAAPTPEPPPAAASAPVAAPVAAPPVVVARADPRPAAGTGDDDEIVDWVWPAKGKVVTGFSEAASLKGIDIAGTSGQPVTASAAGKVVYAGTGLRGYGKLIIVKHNATYLSAYAHNKDILVKEGQLVAKGQKIAEMGNTDAEQVKLHFEIRRQGKPMDPLRYLPPA